MDADTHTPLVIDAAEAGRLLDMSRARVVRFANRGMLPVVRLPDGELRFHHGDLREWVDAHRRPAVEATP